MLGSKTSWSMAKASQEGLVKVADAGEKSGVEGLGRPPNVPERRGWNEELGKWRRKERPYRNPARRYRVGKKARIELRRCLVRVDELEERLADVRGQAWEALPMALALVADMRTTAVRWG